MNGAAAVECSIEVNASPEVVYDYLVDPAKIALWLAQEVTAEARPGGELVATGESGTILRCEYLELEPPRRVLLTWGWEQGGPDLPPGASKVEMRLTPEAGRTTVTVRHFDLPPDLAATHEQGWLPALEYLRLAAEGRPGSARCIGDPVHGCGD